MTDKAQSALCLDARDRLRERKRLTDAHVVALKNATSIPDEAREKMLALHLALTVAAPTSGKRMTEFDKAYLAEHAPEALADVSTTYERHLTAMRMKSREASKADQELGNIPKPKDPIRRAAALEDFGEFLNVYFRGEDRRFYAPFSTDHNKVIASALFEVLETQNMLQSETLSVSVLPTGVPMIAALGPSGS